MSNPPFYVFADFSLSDAEFISKVRNGAENGTPGWDDTAPLFWGLSAMKTKYLLEAHAFDPNARNFQNRTPLFYAPIESVKILLDFGADVEARDIMGIPAVSIVHAVIARLLLEAGADVNCRDQRGRTPLMYSYSRGNILTLIEAGADINAQDNEGKTALMLASYAESVQTLIEAGADLNARDNEGMTALMHCEHAFKTRLLLEAGANFNLTDNRGCGVNFYTWAEGAEQIRLLNAAGYVPS